MWEKPSYEIIELGCEITAYLFSEPELELDTDKNCS